MKNIYIIVILVISGMSNAQQAGTLNNFFSENGWDASIYGNNNGFALKKTIIQPDGKILACAEGYFPTEARQAVLVRYNNDGSFDSTFGGGDGTVRTKDDPAIDLWIAGSDMGLQSSGKIIIVGDIFTAEERIIRLNTDGSLDYSFGINGVTNMPRFNGEIIYYVGIQSDNKIVVCGPERRTIDGIMTQSVFLWRFTEDGILDGSFGNAGIVSYNFSTWAGSGENSLVVSQLLIDSDDKIIINQTFNNAEEYFLLLRRLNADGSIDVGFGTNGSAIKTDPSLAGFRYSVSAFQENGSIISSFTSFNDTTFFSESLFRLNSFGEIDPSFNVNLGNPTNNAEKLQLKISGDKLYVIKKLIEGYNYDHIFCFDLNGNLVTTFGNDGIVILNQHDIPQSYGSEVAISPDGNIYLVSGTKDLSTTDDKKFLAINVFGFDPNLLIKTDSYKDLVTVSPNPTSGMITISKPENLIFDKIEVIDILGKTISVSEVNNSQIDLSSYSSGIYVVKFYSDDIIVQKKIIKH